MVVYRQGACETSNATYTRRPLQNGSWLFFDPDAVRSSRPPFCNSLLERYRQRERGV
jgi:hypothetical protein